MGHRKKTKHNLLAVQKKKNYHVSKYGCLQNGDFPFCFSLNQRHKGSLKQHTPRIGDYLHLRVCPPKKNGHIASSDRFPSKPPHGNHASEGCAVSEGTLLGLGLKGSPKATAHSPAPLTHTIGVHVQGGRPPKHEHDKYANRGQSAPRRKNWAVRSPAKSFPLGELDALTKPESWPAVQTCAPCKVFQAYARACRASRSA